MKYNEEMGQTGVYSIVNKQTGQTYIGMAGTSFGMRWMQHRTRLNRNRHENRLLQEDWNCFGADAFEFRILEVFLDRPDRYTRAERERVHFDAVAGEVYNL